VFAKLNEYYERLMPQFWLAMKPQYQWALGIAIFFALWIATGVLHAGKPTEAQAKTSTQAPLVRVARMTAVPHEAAITLRGRTEALHQVDVRAEVDGVVQSLHVEKGDHVKSGQVLCELRLNDRGARAAQAEAQVAQAGKELEVARELFKEGFRSKTQMAQAQATYEAARAVAATMNIQLEDTKIRAPFAGVVEERYANVGDYLPVGSKCAMVIAPEPFLAVGTVSEELVSQIAPGTRARVKLVTGENVEGKVRFVAEHADPVTRTFRVEVELPNPDARLRSGVSADIVIVPDQKIPAYHITPGILVLEDNGLVGVRAVEKGVVKFLPVQVISDGPDGMWIAGLPLRADVITVGQEFVTNGERVKAVYEKQARS
jgi:multidrug efflux system membrane fusion protein